MNLQTLTLSVLLTICYAEPTKKGYQLNSAAAKTGVHFRREGRLVGSLSYAHAVINFDLAPIFDGFDIICNHTGPIQRLRGARELLEVEELHESDQHQANTYASSKKNLDRRCLAAMRQAKAVMNLRSNDYGFEGGMSIRRNKRALWMVGMAGAIAGGALVAALSHFFSAGQLLDISFEAYKGTDPSVRLLRDADERIREMAEQIQSLQIAAVEVSNFAKDKYWVSRDMVFLEGAISGAEEVSNRIVRGVKSLMDGSASPDLINPEYAQQLIVNLRSIVNRQGLNLLMDSTHDIYLYETSFLSFANNTLRCFIHFPLHRPEGLLELYRYLPAPIIATNQTFFHPLPENELLAISKTRLKFREMTDDNLQRCHRLRDIYYCPRQNFYHKNLLSSCLMNLFTNKKRETLQSCRFRISPPHDFLVQFSASDFLMYVAEKEQAFCRCSAVDPYDPIPVNGLMSVALQPGCSCSTQGFYLEGATDLYVKSYITSTPDWDLRDVLPPTFDLGAAQNLSIYSEPLKIIEKIRGLNLKDYESAARESRYKFNLRISVWGALIIVAIAVMGLILCKCRKQYRRYSRDRSDEPIRIEVQSPESNQENKASADSQALQTELENKHLDVQLQTLRIEEMRERTRNLIASVEAPSSQAPLNYPNLPCSPALSRKLAFRDPTNN